MVNRPWTWWLAWIVCATSLAVLVPVVVLAVVNRNAPEYWAITDQPGMLGIVLTSLVGVVLATRRPRHAIGWLLLGCGLVAQLGNLATQWGVYGLETRPGTAGATWALWAGVWLGIVAGAPLSTVLLLLFPSGRFADRRSWVVAGLSAVALAAVLLGLTTTQPLPPEFAALYQTTPNPFQLSIPHGPANDPGFGFLLLALCGLLAVLLLLGRLRHARGVARQQYKWVVLAMTLIVVGLAADFVARASGTAAYVVTSPALELATTMVPVTIGIAILRFHLFDIDRVISRALAYALLTAGLLGAYGMGIVLFQRLLDPVAGSSDLAVAATTLLVAALFRPLRARIQRAVDQRFNRAHYDAARIIEEFSSRLRGESDLATTGSELQAVISQTMQPTHVSLWLRSPGTG